MSAKKLSPEEELEKQYRDYKAQFDQWKEKNKGSEGTEGYIKYVKDFEKWEKEVEQRRITVRNKAEQERKQNAERNVPVQMEEPQDEATVAARYAQEQEQYTAMHLRGIQDQERQRQKHRPIMSAVNQSFNAVAPPEQQHLQHTTIMHTTSQSQYAMHPQQSRLIVESRGSPMPLSSVNIQHSIEHDMDSIRNGPHIRAEPHPSSQQMASIGMAVNDEHRQTLWGPDGADYPPTDSMFIKWGARALPPNARMSYQPPSVDTPITPSWYLLEKMKGQGLFYGYNVNLSGIPEVIQQKIVPLNAIPDLPPLIVQQPPKIELPDFSRPPPMFDPSRPPPVSIMPSNSIPPFNSITTVSASLNEPPPIPQFNIAPPIFRV